MPGVLVVASENDQVPLTADEYTSRERGLHDRARKERSKTKLYCARYADLKGEPGRAQYKAKAMCHQSHDEDANQGW